MSAYWLRKSLKKTSEAEQFLREGLQANPRHHEILFELGSIYREDRHDPARARNLWELALRDWRAREAAGEKPEFLTGGRLLGNLAALEEEQQNYPQALQHLAALKGVSPNPDGIQKWIDEVKTKSSQPPPR